MSFIADICRFLRQGFADIFDAAFQMDNSRTRVMEELKSRKAKLDEEMLFWKSLKSAMGIARPNDDAVILLYQFWTATPPEDFRNHLKATVEAEEKYFEDYESMSLMCSLQGEWEKKNFNLRFYCFCIYRTIYRDYFDSN